MIWPACKIEQLDWSEIATQLDLEGYALLPGLLDTELVDALIDSADSDGHLQSLSLADQDLGRGQLFPLSESMLAPLLPWRQLFYRQLARVANRWNEALDLEERFPDELATFIERNHEACRSMPPSSLSYLSEGDYFGLHQRNQGKRVFPMQIAALLSEPGRDFLGGEFVMTEQRPRMQSRPMVLPLQSGDAAIIAAAQRPFKGASGWYRVNLKHGVSRVTRGARFGLDLSLDHV